MIKYPTQKKINYIGLHKYITYIKDSDPLSSSFFKIKIFPERLTLGKNVIKIAGNDDLLKPGTKILFEAIDSNNNPIYYEIDNLADSAKNRTINLFIDKSTASGDALLTFVSVAMNVPVEWSNQFNIKWSRRINVDLTYSNDSDIIFDKLPTGNVEFVYKTHNELTFPSGSIITRTSGSDNTLIKYYYNRGSMVAKNNLEIINLDLIPTGNVGNNIVSVNNVNNILYGNDKLFDVKSPNIVNVDYISEPTVILTNTNPNITPDFTFNKDMVGGRLFVNDIMGLFPDVVISPNYFVGIIKEVKDSTTALLTQPFVSNLYSYICQKFEPSNFSLTYNATPNVSSSQAYTAYTLINLHDIKPINGVIYKIKSYCKSKSGVSEYKSLGETILSSPNLLTDTTTQDFSSIGEFKNTSSINNWTKKINNFDIYHVTTPLMDGMQISGSYENYPYEVTTTNKSIYFYKDEEYQIIFNAYANNDIIHEPELKIYFSGSGFTSLNESIVTISPDNSKYYKNLTVTFNSNTDGYGQPIFKVNSGIWTLSDIRIKPKSEYGYNPGHLQLSYPIDTKWNNEYIDFKIEFYNYVDEMSEQILYIKNILIPTASSTYVQGNLNLVTGSMFIGQTPQGGIKLSGECEALITTNDFEGYNSAPTGIGGFMFWSGSVKTPDGSSYRGSGIQMHVGQNNSGSFDFGTDPPRMSMYPTYFKIGSDTQYIETVSGSIQIVSPNLIVTYDGNVYISGSTSGSSGNYHPYIKTVTETYNIGLTDFTLLVDDNIYMGDMVLPETSSAYNPTTKEGLIYHIKKIGSSSREVQISTTDGVYIDEYDRYYLPYQYDSIHVQCNADRWHIL